MKELFFCDRITLRSELKKTVMKFQEYGYAEQNKGMEWSNGSE